MTQDEIIEMWDEVVKYAPSEVRITEFAQLVAAKEREALCEAMRNKEAWNFYDPADTAIKIIRARGES
jgi:hypothetical protein